MPIGGLQSGCGNAMVVALIIGKSDPRMVTMKRDGSLRWVTNFTLRDSPADMVSMSTMIALISIFDFSDKLDDLVRQRGGFSSEEQFSRGGSGCGGETNHKSTGCLQAR